MAAGGAGAVAVPDLVFPSDFDSKYLVGAELGAGAYGKVYECRQAGAGMFSPRRLAVKIADFGRNDVEVELKRRKLVREVSTWASLVHSAIVPLRDCFMAKGRDGHTRAYLVMDMAPISGLGGESPDIVTFVNASPALTELQVAFVMFQVLGALSYMHNMVPKPVMHRDIKPENIILWAMEYTRDGTAMPVVKLADFGGARVMDEEAGKTNSGGIGTIQYMAPELLRLQMLGDATAKYGPPADIYSMGSLMFVMLTGNLMFPPQTTPRQMVDAMEGGGINFALPAIASRSAHCQDLLKALLAAKPEERLTATQALGHPFFNEIRMNARPPAASW